MDLALHNLPLHSLMLNHVISPHLMLQTYVHLRWPLQDRSFTFILKTPPASVLVKKAAGALLAVCQAGGCYLKYIYTCFHAVLIHMHHNAKALCIG